MSSERETPKRRTGYRTILSKGAHCPLCGSLVRSSTDTIPGIAGESPCTGCGKGMDGAFDEVVNFGGKWYHANCAPKTPGGSHD
jgi:hypothetical protein